MSRSPDVAMFYVFRYAGGQGPYFCGSSLTAEQAIAKAKAARTDRWTRTIVRNVRAGVVVWDSDAPGALNLPLPIDSGG